MNETFELIAERRDAHGTGASRRIRKQGKVPAVVYGGEGTPADITLSHNEVLKHLEHEAFYSHILSLDIDGKKEDVLLKDVHRHPNGPHILHMDFLRVGKNTKVRKPVPLHFIGEDVAPGIKQGGQLTHSMNSVELVCLVIDLPEYVEVDLSQLGLGETIHLSDIKLPKGIQIAALLQGVDHDSPVAVIHKARGAGEAEEAPAGE